MELSYWQARWRKDKTGWHMQQVYPHLKTYWPVLALPAGAAILVPLCGKSRDLIWLKEKQYKVIGVEISEKAAELFFNENGLSFEKTRQGPFNIYSSENLSIWNGDFFKLRPSALPEIDAIYDKAALIALPKEKREEYAGHSIGFTQTHTQILMNTFEYNQEEMSGPPFSVPYQEVLQLYGGHFEIELLHEASILKDLPKFQTRGLSSYLTEKLYHLKPL